MANELAVRSDVVNSLDDVRNVARLLAASNYFEAKGGSDAAIAQLATKVLAGREMGFAPFASVNGIHVIQGKPTVSANLMAAAVKGSGRYDYRVRKMDDAAVSIEFFERVGGKLESIGVSTFTAEDAKKAGTQNMAKFARNMLFARAMSNGVRWYCPDVFSGNAVYTPEELGAAVDNDGDVIETTYRNVPEPLQRPQPTRESEYAAPAQNVAPSAPESPTEALEPESADDMAPHEWAYERLTGNCRKFADWTRSKHADSKGPATAPMYQFLAGVLDGITGNTMHKEIMAVLVGRPVTSDNPPGFDLVSQLLDWLPETTGKGEAKAANPNHKAQYIGCIRNIGELVLESQGQAALFDN